VHACPTLRTRKSRRLAIGCGQSENESPLLWVRLLCSYLRGCKVRP
jgi:hypothetical protein